MPAPSNCAQYVLVTNAGNNDYNGIYERVTDSQYLKQGDSTKQIWYSMPPPHLSFLPDFWRFSPNPYAGNSAYDYQIPDKNNPPCLEDLPGPDATNWGIGNFGSAPMPTVTVYSLSSSSLSPQVRRKIYLRKQIKLGNKKGAALK